jgi:hypothetical protein
VNVDNRGIVSAIVDLTDLAPEQLLTALTANVYLALAACYVVSEGDMFAAFIHPLSALNDTEVSSAVR